MQNLVVYLGRRGRRWGGGGEEDENVQQRIKGREEKLCMDLILVGIGSQKGIGLYIPSLPY
jgi:hypothetical protein